MRNDDRELKELLNSYKDEDFDEQYESYENREKVKKARKKFEKDIERTNQAIVEGKL